MQAPTIAGTGQDRSGPPVSLHQRASGVVRYAEMTGEPEEILSLTDLVRNALAELVAHY